jgi:2-dehydro-3-deoxygalactonokinase
VPLLALPRHLVAVGDAPAGAGWHIVPGLSWHGADGRVDVMRGEETQLLGAAVLAPVDGWTVLPGTHSKWVLQQGGAVAVLRTYLTGELFASLRERGTLAPLMAAAGTGDAAADFDAGVRALGDEELSHALFGARARVMAGRALAASTAEYVSGLLMAAEWRDALRRGLPETPVRLVGDVALAERQTRCARHYGRSTQMLDPEAVQLAAWRAIQRGLTQLP